ncbi:MAG: VWA domain-containing protein [Actinobacteria bacterium]|nr:VWA domain-containing protein [Actinomycetota bacterium]
MRLANPAGLVLLALAVPIVVLHILKPRRPPVTVSSTWLWEQVARPVSSATPWQRLRFSTLLLLQLLAVLLLAAAVARPVRVTAAPLAEHTVFVVDTSGSMAATDGRPDRLAEARRRAQQLRRQLPSGGRASVVDASSQPRVVLSASTDPRAFSEALGALRVQAGRADFATAFTLAESLETPDAPLGLVLLSDGGLTTDEKRLLPAGTRYVRVGERSTNRAITRLVAEPQGSGLRALVTLRNTGGRAATQQLRLDVDGRTEAVERVRLPAGATVERQVDLPGGDRVEAFVEGEDLLAADNHAFAVAGRRRSVRVALAGEANPFLDRLLAAIPGVTVQRLAAPGPVPAGVDLAVFDRVAVPADPGVPFLAIAAPAGAPGVRVQGSVDQPVVTLVRSQDPLLEGLDLSDVAIAVAQRVSAPGDEVLVAGEGGPLLVRGSRGGRLFAYLTFALGDSNLPLQVAFPILGDRLVTALAGAAVPPSDLRVGQPLPVAGDLRLRRPGGGVVTVSAGAPAPLADRPGFYQVEQPGRPDRLLAVNAEPAESFLAPADTLPVPERPAGPGQRPASGEIPLLGWLVSGLLVVLGAEYLVSRRAIGVPRRQWRAGLVVRVVLVLLLLGALAGVALPRQGRGVATVFLLDGSDSLGSAGRDEAVRWVRQALASQPEGARAGVAVFGGDAKLELTVQADATLVEPAVAVDTSRTNLAGALRLAAAVLPGDARRRVVVVSDGRLTDGDAAAEAARLRQQGVEVDVHTVSSPPAGDVAVARLEAPGRARQGESLALVAHVEAPAAGTARVTLQRDGVVVEERVVELAPGDNPVTFRHPAGESGVARLRVEVSSAGDPKHENDVAYAAVEVEGPARALVVEGAPGNGATLAAALRASGLVVDTVAGAALPAFDRLAGYAATVLVDVDARTLGDDQVRALGAATRDLGRGLVTVGGDRSYALGGYRDSELERLLPVVSEILDPKRRDSVAQVLAIDTSGSMGACHCAEGGANGLATGANQGGRTDSGGVNKTDISRAGAARAIQALSANDQVGVLAFNTEQKFVIPLQRVPPEDVVTKGLRGLQAKGGTEVPQALERAAKDLRAANAKLKHIILFTDGFTSAADLAALEGQAAALADEGITVSVLATGEGASTELERVAVAGKGRFYPGRDLNQIPQILQQEAVIASRNFVNEGEYFPKVTGSAPAARSLTKSPPLFGYVATSARPTAQTQLRIGEDDDPLLATWRVGLGKAASWTSDASARWSQAWVSWDQYAAFWAAVVKDTFADGGSAGGGVRARIQGDRLEVVVEGEAPWPAEATATARVTDPDLRSHDVALERTSGTTFAGELPAPRAGTYAVGATVTTSAGAGAEGTGGAGTLLAATALASQSYAPEYRPGPADAATLQRISRLSGGRGEIRPAQAFDAAGLQAGRGRVPLAGWLLLVAALLWPLDVTLRRLNLRADLAAAVVLRRARPLVARLRPPPLLRRGSAPSPPATPPAEPEPAPAPPPTLGRLLERKRGTAGDAGAPPPER